MGEGSRLTSPVALFGGFGITTMQHEDNNEDLASAIGGFIDGLKAENAKLKALLKRGLDEFGWMDGPEDWPDFICECRELLEPNVSDQIREE